MLPDLNTHRGKGVLFALNAGEEPVVFRFPPTQAAPGSQAPKQTTEGA